MLPIWTSGGARFILCAAVTCRSLQQRTEPVSWPSDVAVAELSNKLRTGTLSYIYFVWLRS
jgi:hypothetical protein